jgi:L-amino acid N-acyltransferase YncA
VSNIDNYSITLATTGDFPQILNFYRSLIGTPGCTWHLDYPNEEIIKEDIDTSSLYFWKENDIIISVAFAGISDELNELPWSLKKPCDLARIGVAVSKQKQGIGSLMLSFVTNDVKSRGFDGMRFLVSKENAAALALYDKNGFIRCGETHMYDIDFYCYEMIF